MFRSTAPGSGPPEQQLVTRRDAATNALFPPVDYPVGIIAGNRSIDPVVFAVPAEAA